MKRLYAVAVIATTFFFRARKNMGTGSGEPQEPSSAVPADFKWETTRDLDISVGMPSVTGNTPQYAVIRVYCSPDPLGRQYRGDGCGDAIPPRVRNRGDDPGRDREHLCPDYPARRYGGRLHGTGRSVGERRRCADEGRSRDALTPDGRNDAWCGRQFDARLPAAHGEGRGRFSSKGPSSGIRLPARSTWVRAGLLCRCGVLYPGRSRGYGHIGLNGTFLAPTLADPLRGGQTDARCLRYDRPGDARSASGRRGVHP